MFADEEVPSNSGYLSGYTPKSVTEQIAFLRTRFPKIGMADEKLAPDARQRAEGSRHPRRRGSVRSAASRSLGSRAREVVQVNEHGLGAFAVGIMLLTHPERLMHYDDLYIDCAGDEYAPDGDGLISQVPVFHFAFDRVGFDAGWFDNVHNRFGSVSAFLACKALLLPEYPALAPTREGISFR